MKVQDQYQGVLPHSTEEDPNIIRLTPQQEEFFTSNRKFVAFVGGFGSGKSQALFVKMMYEKFLTPDVNLLYAAPNYGLIRDIAFDRLELMLTNARIPYSLNRMDQWLDIPNYGKVLFRTLENPDRLVGFEVHKVFIDELDTLPFDKAQNAWNKLMARCRQQSKVRPKSLNQMFIATTPEGFRFTYDRWIKRGTPDYHMVRAPTMSNPYLPQGYIDALKSSYSPELVRAYLDGEFVNLVSKVVYQDFSRTYNTTTRTYTNNDILHIGMDFNVRNMNATIFVIDNGQVFAVGELTKINDTPNMINTLQNLFPNHFPHNIVIYPDAYADSRKTSSAESDHALLRRAQLKIDAPNGNPPIRDRIMSVNHMFCDGAGIRRFFVNIQRCPELVQALEQQTYDSNGMPSKDDDNNYDDINDSMGYFIHRKFPIVRDSFTVDRVRNY